MTAMRVPRREDVPRLLPEEKPSFHRGGDCHCPRPRKSGRVYSGYAACAVCGKLMRRKERRGR